MIRIALTSIAIVAVTLTGGCQEFLPPREDLSGIFTGSVRTEYDVFYPSNAGANRNQLLIFVSIVNNNDDAIQDYIDVNGTVNIELQMNDAQLLSGADPNRTYALTTANLLHAAGYDAASGVLVFAPKDTITLLCAWDFTSNDKTRLIDLFPTRTDSLCLVLDAPGHASYRKVTNRQQFRITGSVRLSKRTSTVQLPPMVVSHCFVFPYLSPLMNPDSTKCISEKGIDPCLLVP